MDATKQRALVTGASSGFGVEIARVLAQRGFQLAIAARRRERLEALAAELQRDHGVNVAVFVADLSTPAGAQQLFDDVRAAGLQIDMLVNNAGLGHFGPFLDQSLDQILEMIAVDVTAATVLTRLYAQAMVKQGWGRILQVSSFAALQPIPRYAIYSGAKAFLIAMAQGLQHELRKTGVRISVVAPGFMHTEFHEVAHHERTLMMKLTNVPVWYTARKAVSGMLKGKLLITPGPLYQVNGFLIRFLPRRLASAISAMAVGGKKVSANNSASPANTTDHK